MVNPQKLCMVPAGRVCHSGGLPHLTGRTAITATDQEASPMANLTLYGLKNCDTCKKAMNALDKDGHDVELVDIRADTDLKSKVPAW
ncbi:MAG: glutaredoxin domain-containing protein, partial [Henriciella sp.]